MVSIELRCIIYKWGPGVGGFTFYDSPSGWHGKQEFWGVPPAVPNTFNVPMDPLTAISLRLVIPEELNYPAGILAAFNVLKGNS